MTQSWMDPFSPSGIMGGMVSLSSIHILALSLLKLLLPSASAVKEGMAPFSMDSNVCVPQTLGCQKTKRPWECQHFWSRWLLLASKKFLYFATIFRGGLCFGAPFQTRCSRQSNSLWGNAIISFGSTVTCPWSAVTNKVASNVLSWSHRRCNPSLMPHSTLVTSGCSMPSSCMCLSGCAVYM